MSIQILISFIVEKYIDYSFFKHLLKLNPSILY